MEDALKKQAAAEFSLLEAPPALNACVDCPNAWEHYLELRRGSASANDDTTSNSSSSGSDDDSAYKDEAYDDYYVDGLNANHASWYAENAERALARETAAQIRRQAAAALTDDGVDADFKRRLLDGLDVQVEVERHPSDHDIIQAYAIATTVWSPYALPRCVQLRMEWRSCVVGNDCEFSFGLAARCVPAASRWSILATNRYVDPPASCLSNVYTGPHWCSGGGGADGEEGELVDAPLVSCGSVEEGGGVAMTWLEYKCRAITGALRPVDRCFDSFYAYQVNVGEPAPELQVEHAINPKFNCDIPTKVNDAGAEEAGCVEPRCTCPVCAELQCSQAEYV
ncbi:hypothetical protein JKP88DRAFT_241880 [Tribonema minus]|uniref:Uncharacterized protein n=1 Tax=Tribonema minus TaxID=303371 RepID=A0A836CB24_9STRA|nr:hypothetical protein JKP88DRAFT_241880 [Tribonema minus]